MDFRKALIALALTCSFPLVLVAQSPKGDIPLSDEPVSTDEPLSDLPDTAPTQAPRKSPKVNQGKERFQSKKTEIESEDHIEAEEPVDSTAETVPLIRKKREMAPSLYRQDTRYIEHPNAAKGLIRIEKDKTYIYRVPESDVSAGASLRIGMYKPENLNNPDSTNLSFNSIYTEDSYPMIQYDYERPIFKTAIGKLSWNAGLGFYFAQGQGQFANGNTAEEKFSLFVFPFTAGLVYRLQFWDSQPVVPFGGGGFDAFTFAERRDDDLNPSLGARFGLAPAAHFNGGLAIRLGSGARAFVDLDREYGVNSLWAVAEYRHYIALSDKFDFSSDFIGGGIFTEY